LNGLPGGSQCGSIIDWRLAGDDAFRHYHFDTSFASPPRVC
jgi:hypothetical protein